jgi:hypothetical protein
MMSAESQERLRTSDLVSAAQGGQSGNEPTPATHPNVRRLEHPRGAEPDGADQRAGALLPGPEAGELRQRWDLIQTGFVDEPRHAVEDADSLVAQAMKRIAEVFAEERTDLERQWSAGQDISTEDLRLALKRYRSFFDRLLSV